MVKKKIPDIPGFYDIFKIGIEIEGEFYYERESIEDKLFHLRCSEDGSLNATKFDEENLAELKSGVIQSANEEESIYRDLSRLIPREKNIFAVQNTSCGTHIHFSFKSGHGFTDDDLYVFDTKDFEVYFFKKYMQYFTRKKFFDRIGGTHFAKQTLWFSPAKNAKAQKLGKKMIVKKNQNGVHTIATTIKTKKESTRYFWFNTCAILNGYGAEIRVYPHMQSVNGVKEVIDFTKYVLFSYFKMKKTERILSQIRHYKNLKGKYCIDFDKLNEFEQIVASEMGLSKYIENKNESRYPSYSEIPRGDVRLLIGKLYESKSKAFTSI